MVSVLIMCLLHSKLSQSLVVWKKSITGNESIIQLDRSVDVGDLAAVLLDLNLQIVSTGWRLASVGWSHVPGGRGTVSCGGDKGD